MFLRRLDLNDARDRDVAHELFLAAPDYELDTFGRLPSEGMQQPVEARFPADCAPEHRLTFAAFDHDQPIGLAQIALHMPRTDTAALLLLIVPTRQRRQHTACEMVERLSRQARRWAGISQWYLTVTESNPGGLAFWRHCGFRTTRPALTVEGIASRVVLMERPVKGRPSCQHPGAQEDPSRVADAHLFARLP